MARRDRRRPGGWLATDHKVLLAFAAQLSKREEAREDAFIEPIRELQSLVAGSAELAALTQAMFVEGYDYSDENPLGQPAVTSWPEFLRLLNAVMVTAPQFYVDDKGEAAGLVGFPINALLDWPMGTRAGHEVFSNDLFNRQMQKVLRHWSRFLTSEASRYVLADSDPDGDPPTIAWLSDSARRQMIAVACQPCGKDDQAACLKKSFTDIFAVPDPDDPVYLGFASWDEFFTREFRPGMRPVGDAEVVNACESAPLQHVRGVRLSDRFWLKGQAYSLENMLDFDPLAPEFEGGSVYQAFLSALSYHRWNAPVDGTVKKAYVVNGSYYLENRAEGIDSADPDPSAPNASQPYITSVATRAVIFIEADDPRIGLMAIVPVGMAEVSSCEIQVRAGQKIRKGDPLGMFHFGGSTHCLVFRKGVELKFENGVTGKPNLDATNVAVKSNLARVV